MADIKDNDFNDFDEEGIEIVELDGEDFEIIGELEYEGETYLALTRYSEEEDDDEEEGEFIILREVDENGEYNLATIDDEEFSDKIGEMFLELLGEDDEEE